MLRSASRLLRRAIFARQSCPTHQLDEARALRLHSSAQIWQSAKTAHITGARGVATRAYLIRTPLDQEETIPNAPAMLKAAIGQQVNYNVRPPRMSRTLPPNRRPHRRPGSPIGRRAPSPSQQANERPAATAFEVDGSPIGRRAPSPSQQANEGPAATAFEVDEPIRTALVVDPALDQGGLVVDRSNVAEHTKAAAGKRGKADFETRKDEWKARREARNTQLTYSQKLKALIDAGRVAEAEELLHQMCRHYSKPTEVSFNIVIAAYGARGSGHKAFKIFNVMKKRQLKPTAYSYSALFNAFAESEGNFSDEALRLFQEMKDKKVERTVEVYNALMKVFAKYGDVSTTASFYMEMKRNFVSPTSFTYSALIEACLKAGKVEAALDFLELAHRECALTLPVLVPIFTFCRASRSQKHKEAALKLYNDMPTKYNLTPTAHVFDLIVPIIASLGKNDAMDDVLSTMIALNHVPDEQLMNTIVAALAQVNSDRDVVKRAIAELEDRGFKLNSHTCFWLLNSRECSKTIGAANRVVDKMRKQAIPHTPFTLAAYFDYMPITLQLRAGAWNRNEAAVMQCVRLIESENVALNDKLLERLAKALVMIKPLKWYKSFAAEVKTLLKSRGVGLEAVGLATNAGN